MRKSALRHENERLCRELEITKRDVVGARSVRKMYETQLELSRGEVQQLSEHLDLMASALALRADGDVFVPLDAPNASYEISKGHIHARGGSEVRGRLLRRKGVHDAV